MHGQNKYVEWNKKSGTENMEMNKTENLVEFDTVFDEGLFFNEMGEKLRFWAA